MIKAYCFLLFSSPVFPLCSWEIHLWWLLVFSWCPAICNETSHEHFDGANGSRKQRIQKFRVLSLRISFRPLSISNGHITCAWCVSTRSRNWYSSSQSGSYNCDRSREWHRQSGWTEEIWYVFPTEQMFSWHVYNTQWICCPWITLPLLSFFLGLEPISIL